jgi:hypothetical protein
LQRPRVGFRLGRRSEANTSDKTKAAVEIVEAAILGILALLLGFTMSMTLSRFEVRKQLVLDEANAIGTCYLRVGLLPPPEGSEIANLVRQYIRVRVQYGTSGHDPARLESLRAQSAELQSQLSARAVACEQKDPNPVKVDLLLQSLNQAIDLESARRTAFQNQVRQSVIYVNAIVGILATMLVGYTFGLHGKRQIFSMGVLALAITLVLSLIIDLDRPRSGFVRGNQQPMMDLEKLP